MFEIRSMESGSSLENIISDLKWQVEIMTERISKLEFIMQRIKNIVPLVDDDLGQREAPETIN